MIITGLTFDLLMVTLEEKFFTSPSGINSFLTKQSFLDIGEAMTHLNVYLNSSYPVERAEYGMLIFL